MPEMTRQERAQEALKKITERRDALSKEAYELSASNNVTVAFGRKMEGELAQLHSDLGAFRKEFITELFVTKVNDHTFTYRVAGPLTDQSQESYIRDNLGADAETLIGSLKNIGVDASVKAPILNEATLDTGSNNKTRTEQNQHYEGGLADPI